MKKIKSSVLLVLSIFTLVGCGDNITTSTSGNSNADSTTSIVSNDSITSIGGGATTSIDTNADVVAKQAKVTMDKTKNAISLSELFTINVEDYEVESDNEDVISVFPTNKAVLSLNHAGAVNITVKTAKTTATCHIKLLEADANLGTVKKVFSSIKTGYYMDGLDYTYGGVGSYEKVVTPKYTYDELADTGYGIFSDGKVYKFKQTTNGFVATGVSLGTGSTWAAGLFQDFEVNREDVYLDKADVILPKLSIDSTVENPLAKSLIKQIGLNEEIDYKYLRLSSFQENGFILQFITGFDTDGKEVAMATVQMSDFGYKNTSIENFLATAEPPVATAQDNKKLKNKMLQYKNSKSYRLYGCDITDTDREIFTQSYTPTQYYESFMDDSFGYINTDGKVYKYTPNSAGFAELESTPYGSYTDYKDFVLTLYTIDDSLFDTCRADPTDDTYYEYVKSSDEGALAKFLLHSLGYDSGSSTNFYDHFEEAAFLVDDDTVYVDIELGTLGEIKFQYDSLNSAQLPTYIKETGFEEFAGTYTGTMSKSIDGSYVKVDVSLVLNLDSTGTFTFDSKVYNITWNPAYDGTNKNKLLLGLEITDEVENGEFFIAADCFFYMSAKNMAHVHFCYDENVAFRPNEVLKKVTA